MIEGVFPNTEILLIYYGGSIAYGLDSELSDKDVTVVLEGFRGNLHLTLGEYDLFVFAKDRFIQRQTFDESIIAYHRAAADNVMSIDRTLIYINPSFQETLDQLLIYDDKEFMINHIAAELEYGRMRFDVNTNFKSQYQYSKYKRHPQNASMATREVNEYIKKNELNPIGPVHQVMLIDKKRRNKNKKNEVTLEVYAQVS
jgi:hypothetical protein